MASRITLPDGTSGDLGRCRSCGAEVVFIRQPSGKTPPFDVKLENGRLVAELDARSRPVSHFSSCPSAAQWKGRASTNR